MTRTARLQKVYDAMTREERRDLLRRFNIYTDQRQDNSEAQITTNEAELLLAIAHGDVS